MAGNPAITDSEMARPLSVTTLVTASTAAAISVGMPPLSTKNAMTAVCPANIAAHSPRPHSSVPQNFQTLGTGGGAGASGSGGCSGLMVSIQLVLFCPRHDREIIGHGALSRQGKVPPFLRIVHKALLRHGRDQFVPPVALHRRDRRRRGVTLMVGAVIAGAHVDAA